MAPASFSRGFVALPFLLLAAVASGQSDTRAEEWRALREAKRQRVAPPRAGWLERTLLTIEKAERPAIFDLNLAGFYPRFGAIGWGSKQAAGVRFWQPDVGRSRLDVHGSAFFSVRSYVYLDLQAGLLPHVAKRLPPRSSKGDDVYDLADVNVEGLPRLAVYGSLRHRRLTELDFYGLGADSPVVNRTSFLLRDTDHELVAAYRPHRRVGFFARGGLLTVETEPGRNDRLPTTHALFGDTTAPGLLRQPDFLHATASVLLDGRDEPFNPRRGGVLALSASRYDDRGGDAFRFLRLDADARAYLPLGSPQRVLALRALVIDDDPDEGSRVPFYLQEPLGGSHTLRGFPSLRFRGERLALFQAEYRWEAAPAVELAAFWEGAAVRRAGEAWDLGDLVTDWGLGLRIKTYAAVIARLDVAKSDEATRVLLRLNHVF